MRLLAPLLASLLTSSAAAQSPASCTFLSPDQTKAQCSKGEFAAELQCASAPVQMPFTSRLDVAYVAMSAFTAQTPEGKFEPWGLNIYVHYAAPDGAHFNRVTLSGGLKLDAKSKNVKVTECYGDDCGYSEIILVYLPLAGAKDAKPGYATLQDFHDWLKKNPAGRLEIMSPNGGGSIVANICQPVLADFFNTVGAQPAKN